MARKKREYDNPILVKIVRADKSFQVEVSDYKVTADHLILFRREGSSRHIKYLRLTDLSSFSFDAPVDYHGAASAVQSSVSSAAANNSGLYSPRLQPAPAVVPVRRPAWTESEAPADIGGETPVVASPPGPPPISPAGSVNITENTRKRALAGLPNGGMS